MDNDAYINANDMTWSGAMNPAVDPDMPFADAPAQEEIGGFAAIEREEAAETIGGFEAIERGAEIAPPEAMPTIADACQASYIRMTVPYGWDSSNVQIRYGVSYDALEHANPGVELTALRAGQPLCVPPPGTRTLCEGGGYTYIVERSDTLDTIARHHRCSVAYLLRANPSLAPQDFVPGRVVCVPE